MRQGPYEVLLVGAGGKALQESDLEGGNIVVSAEPGTSYHVLVNIYRDENGLFPAKYLRFGLYVDGIDVQYWKRIDLSNEKLLPSDKASPVCSRFWGFKKNQTEMLSFTFSAPNTTSAGSSSSSAMLDGLGTVKLVIFEAHVTTGVYENKNAYGEAPEQRAIGESAKFWQQASVTTTAGKPLRLEREEFAPLPRWSNVSKDPLATLVLRYHTASMIEFLAEFQHQLHDGPRQPRSSSSSSAQVCDLTGDDETVAVNSSTACSSSSSSAASDSIFNEAAGESRQSGEGDVVVGAKRAASEALGSNAASHSAGHSSSSTESGSAADDGPEPDREEPIDEEISYVVRKKFVPIMDLLQD